MTDYKLKYLKYKKKYLDLKTGGSIYYNNNEPILVTISSYKAITIDKYKRYKFDSVNAFFWFCDHYIEEKATFHLYPILNDYKNYKIESVQIGNFKRVGNKDIVSDFMINSKKHINSNNFKEMCVVFY